MGWRTLFFDLDDTLYPGSSGVWQAIGARIHEYMVQRVGIAPEDADRLRGSYLDAYGTTLNGLVANFHVDPHDYLEFVHDIPVDEMLEPDPSLRQMLTSLTQRKVVFTNANRTHADRVLKCLGIADLINTIADLFALEMTNKPEAAAYRKAMALAGEPDPTACVIVDDMLRNLIPAGRLGMTTVLISSNDLHAPVDRRIASIHELTAALPELL